MKKLLFIRLVACLLFSCKKENSITHDTRKNIKCDIKDYYTGEPLSDVNMSFDVASGSGIFGDLARDKYQAVSNAAGEFILSDVGDDIRNTFYPNFIRSMRFDSTKVEWRYFIEGTHDELLWISKGYNTTLRLKPAGITYFHHPSLKNPNYNIDTIIIKAYNQTDLITLSKPKSYNFELLPSATHKIELTYIHNGNKTVKTINKYISGAFQTSLGNAYVIGRTDFNIDVPE